MKLRKYLAEFVVWERIPSSLPFGKDVVLKSGKSIWKMEWDYGNYLLEEIGVSRANLSAFVFPYIPM